MRIDPFGPSDAAAWLPLLNLTRRVPLTEAEFSAREALRPTGDILLRVIGRTLGEPVAIGQLTVAPYAPADHVGLLLCTAPEQRRLGIGTAMLEHLEAAAVERGFSGLTATLPARTTDRVAQVIANVRKGAEERDLDPDQIERIWTDLIETAIAHEAKMLGEPQR